MSATTFISSPILVNVTVPSTLLSFVGCRTAIALVGSCANAVANPIKKIAAVAATSVGKRFRFMRETTPADGEV